ncbi:MAG: thiamine phosphate synthase [Deltaproteobacteria bacterium]|nr:thiamine phosphate synthase [Deltaproteobacteria bacterium]
MADPGEAGRDVVDLARQLLAGGARILQLRWRPAGSAALFAAACACRELSRRHGAVFLVNDRVDVALACGADGVHLGQTDLPIAPARRWMGERCWIGVSTHDREQARAAAAAGADYIGFGPIFATSSKHTGYTPRGLDALRAVRRGVDVPIVAIGGIDEDSAAAVLEAGADAVAMISALTAAPDVSATVRRVLARLDSTRRPQ